MVFEDGMIGEFQHYAAKFGPKVIGELKRLKSQSVATVLMSNG